MIVERLVTGIDAVIGRIQHKSVVCVVPAEIRELHVQLIDGHLDKLGHADISRVEFVQFEARRCSCFQINCSNNRELVGVIAGRCIDAIVFNENVQQTRVQNSIRGLDPNLAHPNAAGEVQPRIKRQRHVGKLQIRVPGRGIVPDLNLVWHVRIGRGEDEILRRETSSRIENASSIIVGIKYRIDDRIQRSQQSAVFQVLHQSGSRGPA